MTTTEILLLIKLERNCPEKLAVTCYEIRVPESHNHSCRDSQSRTENMLDSLDTVALGGTWRANDLRLVILISTKI